MNPQEQDAELAKIDAEIGRHIAARDHNDSAIQTLMRSSDYHTQCIRALGKRRSEVATYELFKDVA
jgi:lipopolysaccharide biosynthesis regulator YciM